MLLDMNQNEGRTFIKVLSNKRSTVEISLAELVWVIHLNYFQHCCFE